MTKVRNVLALLRGQLWLIPALMSAAAFALAAATLAWSEVEPRGTDLWWLHSGDAGTARDLLAALLSGLLTMTSLVVSMTFVVLTLASSQLGPRLVWNFTGDRQIQAVLGGFVGTILYVLLVLRSLDATAGAGGVPHLAVTTGTVLTIACLLALLFYVHKIARSIVADTVVNRVAGDLRASIRGMLPADAAGDAAPCRTWVPPPVAGSISLDASGYVQTVDYDALVEVARRRGAVLRIEVRAGHFVLRHGGHVTVLAEAGTGAMDDEIQAIRAAFVVGAERSPAQDLEYAIRQLVEIGVRALSAGINDPFTAVAVVDRLGAALEDVLCRALPPALLRAEAGEVRVIADRSDVGGLLGTAFEQIRQAAGQHPAVLIHLADTLGKLTPALERGDDGPAARRAVLQQLARLGETAEQAGLAPSDLEATLSRIGRARAVIEARG